MIPIDCKFCALDNNGKKLTRFIMKRKAYRTHNYEKIIKEEIKFESLKESDKVVANICEGCINKTHSVKCRECNKEFKID